MAFKENLPIFAVVAFLAAAGFAAVFLFQPAPEEKLRDAAIRHAETLGAVRDVQVHGSVADLFLSEGPVVFAEFRKEAGRWVFAKDLGKDFERLVKDEAAMKAMRDRLAERLAQRYGVKEVGFRKGIQMNYQVVRDERGLVGTVNVRFGVTPQGKAERAGRYIERYRYKEGSWERQGLGSLQEKLTR